MSEGISFDLSVALPGLDCRFRADLPGQGVTAVVGPSGAGKTTLLHALAGLIAARGVVRIGGHDIAARPVHRRGIGLVFQDARLFENMTVEDNIGYGARRRGTPPQDIRAVVEALDLGPLLPRATSHLSGGEARRVALARALAASPDLLLLDEPLSGLDPARKGTLLPYLSRAIAAAGCPALFVTHDRREALALADRTVHIDRGRIDGDAVRTLVVTAPGAIPHRALAIDPAEAIVVAGTARPLGGGIALEATVDREDGLALWIDGARHAWPSNPPEDAQLCHGTPCTILLRNPVYRAVDGGSSGDAVMSRADPR